MALIEQISKAVPSLDATLQAKLIAEIEASRRLSETLRNEKIGVGGAAVAETGSLQRAKIRDVNESLRLVVFNIGSIQGVRNGMPFVIYHGDQPIAMARAVDVRERITGAMVERAEKNAKPQKGDAASILTE